MFTPDQAQVILGRGEDARALLENEGFLRVVDDLSTQHIAAVAASPPGPKGQEAREYHHLLHYALSEILGALKGHQDAAEELKRLLQLEEDFED